MPFIRAGDITIHYLLEGPENAPVVMFSNSLGTNLSMWDAQAAALRGKYRVLRYDSRGHGMTDLTPVGDTGYSMEMLAGDAVNLLKALGIKKVHLCGLSIGGMMGQKLAATAPELLSSLILCDTAATMDKKTWNDRIVAIRKDGIEVIVEGTMQRWFTKPYHNSHPEVLNGIRNMLRRTPAEGYVGCAFGIRDMDLREDDKKITAPTLILVGESDPATTPDEARELNHAIAGSKLTVIPKAAHIIAIEQADVVTKAISDFLAAQ